MICCLSRSLSNFPGNLVSFMVDSHVGSRDRSPINMQIRHLSGSNPLLAQRPTPSVTYGYHATRRLSHGSVVRFSSERTPPPKQPLTYTAGFPKETFSPTTQPRPGSKSVLSPGDKGTVFRFVKDHIAVSDDVNDYSRLPSKFKAIFRELTLKRFGRSLVRFAYSLCDQTIVRNHSRLRILPLFFARSQLDYAPPLQNCIHGSLVL